MGKNIKSVTASLRLGTCREKDIKDAIQYLKELDIALLSEKRLEIADLYYEILKQIQLLYASQEIEIPEEIMMDIRQLFDNIQGICSEPKEREASEAAFSVIMFLAYLRGHNCLTGDNDFSNTDEAIQKVCALRTDLGTIQFIFDLRVEGQLYFPIENMLVSVIKDEQFVEEMSNIDSGHIKVLYLAVHFFDEEEQKRQILTNIVNACNLKFIEYMQNQSELLDTQDLHNYRKNGVIIFIDSSRRKILIRHNDPEYFKGAENIQHENSFKHKERRIGYYVEIDIPEGAARASFEDVMQKHPENSDLVKDLPDAGACVLEEGYRDVESGGCKVRIGGMYEYAFALDGDNSAENLTGDVRDFLEEFQNTDRYKIMLCHRPDSFVFGDASDYWKINLVISGHDHGGQVVIPFKGGLYGGDQGWFPPYVHGLYRTGRIRLFVTSGLSSEKQKLPRWNNRPEIAVLNVH